MFVWTYLAAGKTSLAGISRLASSGSKLILDGWAAQVFPFAGKVVTPPILTLLILGAFRHKLLLQNGR